VRAKAGSPGPREEAMKHRVIVALVMAFWFQTAVRSGSLNQTAVPDKSNLVVTVDAGHPWVDTGLTVRKGDRISFVAAGTIQWGAEPGQVAGPEGHNAKPGKVGKGGLIGRVGTTGKPFAIGNTQAPIVMPKNGELFLGINDFVFGDNSGAFAVTVSRADRP
jgi:PA-IL-like protein